MAKTLFKLLLILFFLISLFYVGFLIADKTKIKEKNNSLKNFFEPKPCQEPFRYSLGSISQEFNLSKTDLKEVALEAENVWEKASGRNLFIYDETASFKVNLIFDERQLQTLESEKLEEGLKNLEEELSELMKKSDSLGGTYSTKLAEYKASVSVYKKRLEKYNKKVNSWNEQGGAPADEYEDLEKEKTRLKEMALELEKQRKVVNELARQANQMAQKGNQMVNEYNRGIQTYKSKYGSMREFEKGVFDGKEINIYQYKEIDDLRLTLIHEFGHALNIGHVENSQSMMYYLLGEQEMENPSLTKEDWEALQTVCQL